MNINVVPDAFIVTAVRTESIFLFSADELLNHFWRFQNILDAGNESPENETDSQQPDQCQESDYTVEDGHLDFFRSAMRAGRYARKIRATVANAPNTSSSFSSSVMVSLVLLILLYEHYVNVKWLLVYHTELRNKRKTLV